jgi:hypothetical protein
MTASRFSTNGQSLPITVSRVATRPGAVQLKAHAAISPEVLLEVAEWLTAEAHKAQADQAKEG